MSDLNHTSMDVEAQYRQVLNELTEAPIKTDRTGTGTHSLFSRTIRHDMSDGFPLLTTKRVAFKTMCVELEGFINGITSKQWYKDRGCNIWNEWCCPTAQKNEPGTPPCDIDDLGDCLYGASWIGFHDPTRQDGKRIDQLYNIINTLKSNPYDRRMICMAWNPLGLNNTALPPCHFGFQVLVTPDEKLNLVWFQRSADWFLGVPFNIASYALLLELIAKEVGMECGELVGHFEDAHLYTNHIDQANEMLTRTQRQLPSIKLDKSLWEWTHKDIDLIGYNPWPKLAAPVAV